MKSFKEGLVVGASGGLGGALLEQMCKRSPKAKIWATYRNKSKHLEQLAEKYKNIHLLEVDPLKDTSLLEKSLETSELDFVIVASGILLEPEKSLRDIDLDKVKKVFSVNTFLPLIISQIVKEKMNTEGEEVFLLYLSAMVGSIQENHLGGWYSYRSSKAALNMCVKDIHLEMQRSPRYKHCKVLAIHPGTTATKLTDGYRKNVKHKVWEPEGAAENILNVVDRVKVESNDVFYNWDGRVIQW